jgi:hypothetical protein
MAQEIIHIDELTQVCGFFTNETTVNNHYGCTHPKQEEKGDICDITGCEHGKCMSYSCPLGHAADLEDLKNLNTELYEDWKNEEHDPADSGADLMVVDLEKLTND